MTEKPTPHSLPGYVKVVVFLTLANLVILWTRNLIVGDHFFSFLESNLFIGSFPVILIAFLLDYFYGRYNTLIFWIGTFLWVLFYPNAPYMISDLIHNTSEPKDSLYKDLVKFDTMIIFSIAMLSLFYGFLSLKIMFILFKKK